eukprot:CAMPEP_0185772342 /NCGR_PEP_ID=MMETSP1174-20130828/68440_1 /TAXON_ID=35687 /ORGANISM="Dictyocha speculum, Strain CCMP1381" /LENGTH=46 /DNA_ID= /DNA_START= /DNA_END= /DNA_ORIENTATION=
MCGGMFCDSMVSALIDDPQVGRVAVVKELGEGQHTKSSHGAALEGR